MEVNTVPYTDVLEGAMERKIRTGTWKEWCWPPTGDTFTSISDFRGFLYKHVYSASSNNNWEAALPKEINGNQPESAEEAALRQRMADVWKEVHDESQRQSELASEGNIRPPAPPHSKQHSKRGRATQEEIILATKDFHCEMIIKMMAALSKEHELLYQLIAHPMIQFIVVVLPEDRRETRFSVCISSHAHTMSSLHFSTCA